MEEHDESTDNMFGFPASQFDQTNWLYKRILVRNLPDDGCDVDVSNILSDSKDNPIQKALREEVEKYEKRDDLVASRPSFVDSARTLPPVLKFHEIPVRPLVFSDWPLLLDSLNNIS